MRQGYVLIEDALTEFADADAAPVIADLIAGRLGLPVDLVAAALDGTSDEPATVLCRAAGLSINVFSAVLRMRRRRRPSEVSPPDALSAFLDLSTEMARNRVRTLAARGN